MGIYSPCIRSRRSGKNSIDILKIIVQAGRMKNRLSKILEKKILAEFDKETIDGVNHFLNDMDKMYQTYKLMSYLENPKKLDDDWDDSWGAKPDA